jgi:hypothetical protein
MEESGQIQAPAALLTVKQPPVPIVYESEWAPKPVCRESKPDSSVVQPVTESLYRLSYPGFLQRQHILKLVACISKIHYHQKNTFYACTLLLCIMLIQT